KSALESHSFATMREIIPITPYRAIEPRGHLPGFNGTMTRGCECHFRHSLLPYLFRQEGKMFARKTFAIPAAFITLLAGAVPVQAGLLDLGSSSSANWTLGGVPCTLIPVPAAAPFGTGTCPGVRPGAIVLSDVGQCTLNFLFVGSDGSRYIGTAGHCILGTSPFGGDVGEMAWAPGTGPEARDAGGNRIGECA